MLLVDSHCHLHHFKNNQPSKQVINEIIHSAEKKNVKYFLNISVSIEDFNTMINVVPKKNNIFYSCGIHPLYVKKNCFKEDIITNLILKNTQVIGIGETGLDFVDSKSDQNIQKKIFEKHIKLAIKVNKPIIIHMRNAGLETIHLLKKNNAEQCSGVLHSFTDNINIAKMILDLGFYISFSGIITFKNADILRKVVKYVPLDRLLIETDSPYLAPVPYRGKLNQPAYLYEIAKCVSYIKKNNNITQVIENLFFNFKNLFNIKN
ncbi:Uncharacterized metal-dependent hydrolase YcfH [Buchnera aphidicola (Thelaxes suberi)]|uniref:TatD family hydrolase n=1 Tax=Buchnera aphidicola TaxID=9 RepID=UPI003463D678